MKTNEASQEKLISLNDIISQNSQIEPTGTQITKKIVTTTQPTTEKIISKKIITTTTRVNQPNVNVIQNTRYNNTPTSNVNKINTTNYSRPAIQTTSYNRNVPNVTNNRNSNNNSNQAYRKNPINQNKQNNQQSRLQNAQSYSGNRNQPKRPEISSYNYKPRIMSPNPGSVKIKTIVRGKPTENVKITHVIYSSQPLEFHITEHLNFDNLKSKPIQISQQKRNDLQKSGKIEVSCSCDNINIKKNKPLDLIGTYTHYQHAQGIGMTDKKENINPQFYSSEIKALEPIQFVKGEPQVQVLEFRNNTKNYNANKTVTKTNVKPVIKNNSNYRSNNNYTQNRGYNNTNQLKNTSSVNNRGVGTGVKKTVTTTSTMNYRGKPGTGSSGEIVKETTIQVKMGNRSQFHNQGKPIVTTSTEKKIYNQNNLLKK